MIAIGIVFIVFALGLYTVAIWSERFAKKLKVWMIVLFTAGFSCDLVGTSIMFFVAKHKFNLALHSIAGYSALIIMFLHLIWAFLSHYNTKFEEYFTRFSIVAWVIWMFAFFSGIPR